VSDQFSPFVYLIKSVMCKLILTKKKFRSLNVYEIEVTLPSPLTVVWDSSAVRRLFFSTCWSRGTSENSTYGKQRIFPYNSALAHFHVSWLSDFIFCPKSLYKSLHQSFFYSFITILPSESGATLHYCTILP
jgi:hypothetical protein